MPSLSVKPPKADIWGLAGNVQKCQKLAPAPNPDALSASNMPFPRYPPTVATWYAFFCCRPRRTQVACCLSLAVAKSALSQWKLNDSAEQLRCPLTAHVAAEISSGPDNALSTSPHRHLDCYRPIAKGSTFREPHHLEPDRGDAACLARDPDSELVWVTDGPEVRP
jgi:hypothetical protein